MALLRQFTKPIKELNEGGIRLQYIEADADDIKVATKLAHTSLGHRLDELPPGTYKLLLALHCRWRPGTEPFGCVISSPPAGV